ncbi:STM4014 family protein [Aquimarina longa]|uniref:STM4014 family protein n=1 Tax=Aquimarina longa TaxID=1080221 RepID=UPI0007853738|nr:STM4014 family protein [Aquimarina longa]
MNQTINHVCIAPKNSRRVQFWNEVLEQYNHQLIHISYLDIINDTYILSHTTTYVFRLESSGEDFETYKSILLLGCETQSQIDEVCLLQEDFGQVARFKTWYRGWCILLSKIKNLSKTYTISFINDPESIAHVFDKHKTQKTLKSKQISCPILIGSCESYEMLLRKMKLHSISQVFIKPSYGSSASGVMAFRYANPSKQVLYTTIKEQNGKLYNSLRIIKYTNPDAIKRIIEAMVDTDLIIEKWIPKWNYNGYSIDFRVVVINNRIEFIVPRASKHMITNLHLGNQKLDLKEAGITEKIQHNIEAVIKKTMLEFPKLNYAGIDILVDRSGKVFVIEINAFGDMLLGIKNTKNKTVYEQEYESLFAIN